MARKKVVLFIVEGITDQESLELLLTELVHNDSQIIFQVVGGDITSDRDIKASNIKDKLTEVIKDGGKRKFKPTDYREVVHLVDMDGVFIPQENIFQDNSINGFIYKQDGIYASDRDRVFYFSSNLEHVLHNERQVDDQFKIKRAEEFQDRYIDDLQGFVDLICKSDFTVKKEYKESWDFIKQEDNSIKRFSNFNILLEDYLTP